jgi:hypothetical protein
MSRFILLVCFAIALQHPANDNHVGKGGQQNAQAQHASPPTPSQSPASTADQKPTEDSAKKQDRAVSVVSVPKISVHTEKDVTDGIMIGCTIVLTIVGIVGTCAAIKTLKAINKQAHYMLVHARHFDKLAKAALANSRATTDQLTEMQKSREIQTKTLILQYRPKIIIRRAKAVQFNFELGEMGECKLRFTLVNTGGSRAHITAGGNVKLMSCIARDVGNIEFKDGDVFMFNQFTLQPGEEVVFEETLSTGAINDVQWENFRQGIKTDPLRYLFLMGTIYYTDDLNIPRSTGISRTYDPKTKAFAPRKDEEEEYAD